MSQELYFCGWSSGKSLTANIAVILTSFGTTEGNAVLRLFVEIILWNVYSLVEVFAG